MSVKIDLPPEIEANLAAQAAAQGISLADYLRHLIEEQAAARAENPLSAEERANFWRDSAGGCGIRSRSPTKRSAGKRSTPDADRA